MAGNIIQTASGKKRADLLAERADLVVRLRALVADGRDGTRDLGVS